MKQIRRNVFETNSSSTHSLTMCSQSQFDDWKAGKILFNKWSDEFVQQYTMTDEDKNSAMEQYKNINDDKPFYKKWDELSEDEINSWYQKYYEEHKGDYNGLVTYNEYFYSYDGLETFTETYISASGDKIIAFGKFGYDG